MTIRLFTMGLKCFGRFDFIVLTFLGFANSWRKWNNDRCSLQLICHRSTAGAKAHMSPLWGFKDWCIPCAINMSPLWG